MRKAGRWVVSIAFLTMMAGCLEAGTDDGPRLEPDTAELSADLASYVVVSPKPSMMTSGDAVPSSGLPEDPCDCATPECLHDWLQHNIGCDVCLTFVCGGDDIAHVCASCPDDSEIVIAGGVNTSSTSGNQMTAVDDVPHFTHACQIITAPANH